MSCNGCRVLRRRCSDDCALRPCLVWIESPQAQAHATLFVSKFFGRSDLMSFISAVPDTKKPALFQSLLYEACGRTVNPVNGAIGLMYTGNWKVCQAAVDAVLAGGALSPQFGVGVLNPESDETSEAFRDQSRRLQSQYMGEKSTPVFCYVADDREIMMSSFAPSNGERSPASEMSDLSAASFGSDGYNEIKEVGGKKPKLLNLFV